MVVGEVLGHGFSAWWSFGVLGNVASPTGGSIRLHCGRNSRPLPLIMDIGPMVTLIIIVKLIIMLALGVTDHKVLF